MFQDYFHYISRPAAYTMVRYRTNSVRAQTARYLQFEMPGRENENPLRGQFLSDELSISQRTVKWLQTGASAADNPDDVLIGWRTIGVRPNRIEAIGSIMADVVLEEVDQIDTIVGISLNGILFANSIAAHLELDVAIFRSVSEAGDGHLSNKYGHVAGRRIVIVDDLFSTGETMRRTIDTLQAAGADIALCIVLVNKTEDNAVSGVPMRGLIRAVRI